MTESLRVFVNGAGVSVPPGSTVLDAVHADMTGRLDGGTVRLGAAGWAVRATA